MDANDGKFQVVTFLAYNHKGVIRTNENHYVSWVPLKYLNNNKNPKWQKYNSLVYEKVLRTMY